MRLCYISTGDFAHVGAYLDWFHRAGHEVHFLALSPSPPRPVRVHELALAGRYDGRRGKWRYLVSMARARELARRLAPDVVHTHYATSGGLAGLACGIRPTVVTAHGTDLTAGSRSAVWRPLLRAVFAQAACVNPVSEGLGRLALELGVDPRKVRVLTPGVDLARFAPRRETGDGPLRLLCARRLDPELDPLTIVEALALAARAGLRFEMTFAGDGTLRGRVAAAVERLGLGGSVSLVGGVPHERMPELLAAHDVYLSASLWDGTSLTLLEAMAAGLYPVISDVEANRAWIEDGVGGRLHRVGDARDLARALLRAAGEPGARARAAAVNRARVAARGDRAANMAELERLYLGLCRRA